MTRKSCAVIIALLVAAAAACDDDGPTTPTGTTIVIYQDTDFRGDSRVVLGTFPTSTICRAAVAPALTGTTASPRYAFPAGWR